MKNKQANEKVLELYKGINPKLFHSLDKATQKKIFKKTVKELCLLAESSKAGAGAQLYQILEKLDDKTDTFLLDIESLIEFGKKYSELKKMEKIEVEELQIQQELSHFSRIMNLDSVIFGYENTNMDAAVDFSRFIELLAERRQDRGESSLSNWGRPSGITSYSISNSPACGLMEETIDKNKVALLAVRKAADDFSPKLWLNEFSKLTNRFSISTATLLFDYLLTLHNIRPDLSFIAIQSYQKNKSTKIEFSGSGGCGLLITASPKDNIYKKIVLKKLTIGKNNNRSFGKIQQTTILNSHMNFRKDSLKIFCFPPEAWEAIDSLTTKKLNSILNTKFSNGWFNQTNALIEYLKTQNLNTQFISLMTNRQTKQVNNIGHKNFQEEINNLKRQVNFSDLLKQKYLSIESAHIHADRLPGEEQWECINITNQFSNLLQSRDYKGQLKNIVMVDELHVVNRLDYKSFSTQLRRRGLKLDYLLLESSPLIRLISIDILRALALSKNPDYRVVERGGNLYLEIPQKKLSIELVANQGKSAVIGCVLFDVAFTLYKSDINYYNSLYKDTFKVDDVIDKVIVNFYNQENFPEKRKKYVESFYTEIPSWKKIKSSKKMAQLSQKETTLNILEDFYKPQQVKVNSFLEILGMKPTYSLYYNMQSNSLALERSGEN